MTRATAQALAISILGAQSVSNSISKTTQVLIVGEKGGGKEKKAADRNIRIVKSEDYLTWVQEWNPVK
jgi:NAD-dependent DNA ligase